ncbi:MAG: glutathione S-transferase family protein, partial [Proteobacteria bacterium]|nr:glutathione S-transferase family protein [Pseudomonadota bacterium]
MNTKPIELISHHLCPYVQRAIIILAEKNIPHTRTYIDLANKPDWFVDLSPIGKVPLLRIESVCLFESAVICEYLDEITPASLHPNAPLEKAYHRSWIEFASSILNVIAAFYNAPDHKAFEDSRTALVRKFYKLDDNLSDGPFFGGKNFHMVDAAYGPVFRYLDVFD